MQVSVIIPTYNRAGSVGQAIDSVLTQTVPAGEIIVVDDGSTDHTSKVLDRYGLRIHVIRQPNKGVSAARNAGLAAAQNDWVAFLDSDDVWTRRRLELLHRDCAGSAAGVHVADILFLGAGYEETLFALRGLSFPPDAAQHVDRPLPYVSSGLSLCSSAVRTDWIRACGGFNEDMRMFEDLDLLVRLAMRGPWIFRSTVVARARRLSEERGQALTAQAARQRVRTLQARSEIFQRLLEDSSVAPIDRGHLAERLSSALFDTSRALRTEHRYIRSLGPLVASARTHPTIKGWLRATALLALGNRGYGRIARGKGFYRETFET